MKQILNNIKLGEFKPFYLLYGEEHYLKKQYTSKLQRALCKEDDTLNTHFFEGKNLSVEKLIDLAETLPFLAPRRVIFIKNSGLFKSGGEKLAEYLSSANESTTFIFTENEIDKRSKLYKIVHAKGSITEFVMQDEHTLKRWIAGFMQQENKKMTEQAILYFLTKTGTDMNNIRTELEKLVSYCLDKNIVTESDIDAICTSRIHNQIFEMINAMADKHTSIALSLYYDLLALKEPPMRILFLIARQYNILLQVKELKNHGYDNKAIASKVGIPPFVVGKYITQASRYKTIDLKNALSQCVNYEESIKTGLMNDIMSVEMLIVTSS